jgi:hypothetical protein
MDRSKLYGLIFIILVILGLGGIYVHEELTIRNSRELHVELLEEDDIPEIFREMKEAQLKKSVEVGVYDYDKSRYVRLDLIDNEVIREDSLIGYDLVSGEYMNYSDYLILKKDNVLHSYSKLSGDVIEVNINFNAENLVSVVSSYDDPNLVVVYINEMEDKDYGYAPVFVNTDRYLLNLRENSFVELDNEDIASNVGGGEIYSSDGSQYLKWNTSVVVTRHTPLLLVDVETGSERTLFEGVGDFNLGSDAVITLSYNKLAIVQKRSKEYVDNDGETRTASFLRNVAIVDLANNFEISEYSYDIDRFDYIPWYEPMYDESEERLILASEKEYRLIDLQDGELNISDSSNLHQSDYARNFKLFNGLMAYSSGGGIYLLDPKKDFLVASGGLEDFEDVVLTDVFSAE